MQNQEYVQDLLNEAEKYRKDKLQKKKEGKSRFSQKEHEENLKALEDLMCKLFGGKTENKKIKYKVDEADKNARILIGKTRKGGIITIDFICFRSETLYFNYEIKEQEYKFNLLSEDFKDISVEYKADIKEFLNKIITMEDIKEINELYKILNKDIKKKYYKVSISMIEINMRYKNLIIKMYKALKGLYE